MDGAPGVEEFARFAVGDVEMGLCGSPRDTAAFFRLRPFVRKLRARSQVSAQSTGRWAGPISADEMRLGQGQKGREINANATVACVNDKARRRIPMPKRDHETERALAIRTGSECDFALLAFRLRSFRHRNIQVRTKTNDATVPEFLEEHVVALR